MRRIVPVVSLVAALVVLGACGGGSDGGGGGPGPVLAISKGSPASGDAQQDTVTAVLPTPLRVIVTEDGTAKAGVVVDWAAVDGQVAQPQSTTDIAGFATMTWTLGTSKGAQAASASLAGATGSPVSFSATAFAGAPVTIANSGGGGEDPIVEVNGVFVPLQAWVADQYGNGIPGVIVDWAVQSGPVIPAAATAVTNSGGFSIMGVGAGATPGAAVVRASTAGIPGVNIDYPLLVVPLPRQVNASGNPTNKFTSVTNATVNPAIDTVVVGQAVKWNQTSGVHTVNSTGAPSFVDSPNLGASGYTYRFLTVGTYQYNCGIHGNLMTGTVEVIP